MKMMKWQYQLGVILMYMILTVNIYMDMILPRLSLNIYHCMMIILKYTLIFITPTLPLIKMGK